MAIVASTSSAPRELVPAGNHVARCYSMIQIGTVEDTFQGETKRQHKVRIGFELPLETRVFNEEKGEQPFVISKEFTLSMHEKSTMRAMLASWRGKAFTEEEANRFDILNLLGKPCMINVVHQQKKDGTGYYAVISAITPLPKGFVCPEQINPRQVLQYEDFDFSLFENLPDFLRDKIRSTPEYKALTTPPNETHDQTTGLAVAGEADDDLPF